MSSLALSCGTIRTPKRNMVVNSPTSLLSICSTWLDAIHPFKLCMAMALSKCCPRNWIGMQCLRIFCSTCNITATSKLKVFYSLAVSFLTIAHSNSLKIELMQTIIARMIVPTHNFLATRTQRIVPYSLQLVRQLFASSEIDHPQPSTLWSKKMCNTCCKN